MPGATMAQRVSIQDFALAVRHVAALVEAKDAALAPFIDADGDVKSSDYARYDEVRTDCSYEVTEAAEELVGIARVLGMLPKKP